MISLSNDNAMAMPGKTPCAQCGFAKRGFRCTNCYDKCCWGCRVFNSFGNSVHAVCVDGWAA